MIHDNGNEFTGIEFQELLQSYGINSKPTTVKNPQANSIVERSHLVISNQLRTFKLDNEQPTSSNFKQIANDLLQATAWALRSTIHSTLQRTPGQLIFQRDMILQIATTTDWDLLRRRKRHLTQKANNRENNSRVDHEYKVYDQVLIRLSKSETGSKLNQPTEGPYRILLVHPNGNLTIQRGAYRGRINIRRLQPYFA